jgi:hypothetical protein
VVVVVIVSFFDAQELRNSIVTRANAGAKMISFFID